MNGTNLAYELTGRGATVVFLHGFTLDLRMWDDQVTAFNRRFQVLRYDQRGFGRSDLPDHAVPYSPTEDLRALLVFLGISKVHLVGLSAGGALAIDFALAHPDSVDRIVLVDSALDGHTWSVGFRRSLFQIDELAGKEGVEAARDRWLSQPLFGPARENAELAKRLIEILQDYSGWHWLHENVAQGLNPRAATRLSSIRRPTLVVVGDRDLPDFRQISRRLAEGIPGALEIVVSSAGHLVNMETPDEFNRLVLGFLASGPSEPA